MTLAQQIQRAFATEDALHERAKGLIQDYRDINRRLERVAHVQSVELRELRSRVEAAEKRGHQLRLHDAA